MKVAICLSGAMSRLGGRFLEPGSAHANIPYINYVTCFNSTVKHIVNANSSHEFDFFLHSCNLDLQENLNKLYCPKASLFEDETPFHQEILSKCKMPEDFGGISKSLSMKKSILLMESYSQNYDLVIIYRPDILLLKDMVLENYDPNNIYVNSFIEGRGDFHFIMSYNSATRFKNLYDSLDNGNPHHTHFWIKNYVTQFMQMPLIEDGIVAGIDQEVLRKVSMGINPNISQDILVNYGSEQQIH